MNPTVIFCFGFDRQQFDRTIADEFGFHAPKLCAELAPLEMGIDLTFGRVNTFEFY